MKQTNISNISNIYTYIIASISKFSGGDINWFCLMLIKGVYPCQCMDCWETLN